MPHKFTNIRTVQNIEDEIRSCDSSINRIKAISGGDLESLKAQIKDFSENASEKKDNALDLLEMDGRGNLFPPHMQEKIAWLNRGQEKAFKIVLSLLEGPQDSISYYESQRKQALMDLEELKSYEIRQDEPRPAR